MTPIDAVFMAASGLIVGIGWMQGQKWLHPVLQHCYTTLQKHLPGARNERMLREIIKELHPNGGSSLRDSLIRIESKLERTHRATKITLRMQRLHEDAAGLASFLADENGRCVYANTHYLALVGLTIDEVSNFGWINAVEENDRDDVIEDWHDAIKDRRDFHRTIQYRRLRTGETFIARCDAYVVQDDSSIIGWVGHLHPLIGRRRYEAPDQNLNRRSSDKPEICEISPKLSPPTEL